MELQKIGAVGLNPREYRSRDGFDTDLAASQERMQETIDRLSQPIKSFKLEKAKISAVWFEIEEMTLFVGLCSGRVGIFVRDPSKHGGVEDFVKEEYNILTIFSEQKHKGEILSIRCRKINNRNYILTGSVDHSIKIWSYGVKSSIQVVQNLVGHDGAILNLDYDAERDFIVSISTDRTMKFWRQEIKKGILLHPYFMCHGQIKCPEDCYGSHLNTKDKVVKERIASNHFTTLIFKRDEIEDLRLLAGDLLGNVHLLRYSEEKKMMELYKSNIGIHRLLINNIYVGRSDNVAYTCSYDQEICAFDVSSGKEFFKYKNPRKTQFSLVRWNAKEQELIATDDHGYLMFINVKGEKGNHEEQMTHGSKIIGLDLAKNYPFLFVATEEEIMFYRINKGFQVQKLNGGHVGPVIGLYYLDFKKVYASRVKATSRLISIGDDNTIRVWDSVDQTELAVFNCPEETEVVCMEYLSKFGLLATGHENGDLYLWDIEIGNKIKLVHKTKFKDNVTCLSHISSSDVDYLIASGYSGRIQVWEFTEKNSANSETLVYPQLKNVFPVEKGRDKESQIGDEILCLACSNQVDYSRHPEMSKLAKDHRLYAAGNSKIIYVIKIMKNATPEYEDKFIGHEDTVTALQLDQNYLFSASEDKSVIIWNTFTKDQLFQIKLHKTFINLMLLCGKMLITGSVDGMIYFYDYPKKHVMTKFKNKDGKLFSMAYSNESRTLFLGSENENILKINYEDLLTLTGKQGMAIESLVKYCTIGKGRLWQRWTFLVLQILVCLVRWNFEVLKALLRALAEEKLT